MKLIGESPLQSKLSKLNTRMLQHHNRQISNLADRFCGFSAIAMSPAQTLELKTTPCAKPSGIKSSPPLEVEGYGI